MSVKDILKNSAKRVHKILSGQEVIFAYLFGSQISVNIGRLSDVDIAVFFKEGLTKSEMFNRKLKIMNGFSFLLKKDDIDVVIINDAYPLLVHRIIMHGKVIFSVDEGKRMDFEIKSVMRYLDFKPYLEKYTRETIYG